MRLYNIQSNRQASSLDIATKFAKLEHLRCVLNGGSSELVMNIIRWLNLWNWYYRIGLGLREIANTPEVQNFLFEKAPSEVMDKLIYHPGVLRKV